MKEKKNQTVAVSAVSITQTAYDENSNALASTSNNQIFSYCTVKGTYDGLDDEDYNESTLENSIDVNSSENIDEQFDNDNIVNSQDVDDSCSESIDVTNNDSAETNAIAQEDAINLTCNNCRRKQCEELINNYDECYRINFFR